MFTIFMILLAVCIVAIIFRIAHRLSNPRQPATPSTQQASQPSAVKPTASTILRECTFRVAGVTFENDDGENRQEILRHLKFRDEPYAEPDTDLTLDLVETTFEDELAIEVHINDYQIGFVPRNKVNEVKSAMDSYAWTVDKCNIYGGSIDSTEEKHSYGCEITISWAS